ncbi:MAG: hypothetical protein JHC26_06415 [Thermofilum sp.]|uniref:hypothetical protein n=1 Tax=Thermofilum sp. TaxID=1961369 RepID=UPI0025912681|nr:hypothetical protein [Thermofilum sp.]MCI4408706.1 hypothetical protein [Thermofilum sp.]
MATYKFSILLRVESWGDTDSMEVLRGLNTILRSYAVVNFSDLFKDEMLEIQTNYASAREHLSRIALLEDAIDFLEDMSYRSSSPMLIRIRSLGKDMHKKLRMFFSNYLYEMAKLSRLSERELEFGILRFDGSSVKLEFRGTFYIPDIRGAILLTDAILQYCESRSIGDIKVETWEDFKDSIRSSELLSYIESFHL